MGYLPFNWCRISCINSISSYQPDWQCRIFRYELSTDCPIVSHNIAMRLWGLNPNKWSRLFSLHESGYINAIRWFSPNHPNLDFNTIAIGILLLKLPMIENPEPRKNIKNIHTHRKLTRQSKKQAFEDVSPVKHGDVPASHVSFGGGGGGKCLF